MGVAIIDSPIRSKSTIATSLLCAGQLLDGNLERYHAVHPPTNYPNRVPVRRHLYILINQSKLHFRSLDLRIACLFFIAFAWHYSFWDSCLRPAVFSTPTGSSKALAP